MGFQMAHYCRKTNYPLTLLHFMFVSLNIVRYPFYFIPMALFSMAVFRIPLMFNKHVRFWKLLGCGKNGTFDIYPDWSQWGLLATWETAEDFEQFMSNSFIQQWWRLFTKEQWYVLCIPYESHGKWDGQEPFGSKQPIKNHDGKIAVLTRASIRFSKLKSFWQNVPRVADSLNQAEGFITSVGIGEVPLLRQATFSIWESLEDVKKFAYKQYAHQAVIKKTRKEDWYSEELFARLIPIKTQGTLRGKTPFNTTNATA